MIPSPPPCALASPSLPPSSHRDAAPYRKPPVPCCRLAPETGIKNRSSPSSRQRLHRRRRKTAKRAQAASGGGARSGRKPPETPPHAPRSGHRRRKGPPRRSRLGIKIKKQQEKNGKKKKKEKRGKREGGREGRKAESRFSLHKDARGCPGKGAGQWAARRSRSGVGASPALPTPPPRKGVSFVQGEPPSAARSPGLPEVLPTRANLGESSPALLPTRLWPQPHERMGERRRRWREKIERKKKLEGGGGRGASC